MAIVMEATSLSSITKIASSPPSTPGQEISGLPLQPLILYIARVPGSQDVFLTTIRPREKVISAEDIQNSLYYIHVSRQDDIDKFDDEQSPAQVDSPVLSYAPVMQDGRIVRKPAPPPRPTTMPGPMHSPTDHNGAEIRIARRPVGAPIQVSQPQRLDPVVLVARPRRPLPAIPQDHVVLSPEFQGQAFEHQVNFTPMNNENVNTLHPHSRSSSEQTCTSNSPYVGSLMLIRRDPVSCEQWNVANISDVLPLPGLDSRAGNVARRFRQHDRDTATALDITILNPSYQKFLSLDNQRPDPHSQNLPASPTPSTRMSPDGIFRRQVHPSHTSPQHAGGSGHHHDVSSTPSILPASDLGAIDTQKRRLFRRSADVTFNRRPLASPAASSGVYNFLSPWGTICEFSPSKIGNNLKCRHRPPRDPYSLPVELSELRFNLPNSYNIKIDNNDNKFPHYTSTRPRSAATNIYRPNSSLSTSTRNPSLDDHDARNDDYDDEDLDDEMRVFQNLGSEKAGGGFGGKRAKLGKLIIYPHGVEMLDLLVAANVGLWWRAWEKVG